MVPLALISPDAEVEVIDVKCGARCSCRLKEMGILPGCRYRVTSGDAAGPIILSDGQVRIGLGFGLAAKVYVREVGDE